MKLRRGAIGYDLIVGLALRGLGAISSFGLLWLISQSSGAETVGAYQLGHSTTTLLAVMAVIGLDVLLIREAARPGAAEGKGDLRATFSAGRKLILTSGASGSVLFLAGALLAGLAYLQGQAELMVILLFAPAVPLLAVLRHGNALLRSQGQVLMSQSLEGVFYTTIAALLVLGMWLSLDAIPPILLTLAYLAGLTIAVGVNIRAIHRLTSGWGNGTAALNIASGLKVTAAPILLMLGDWLLLIMVGWLLGLADTGIYRTAWMICSLFGLVRASFETMAGPHIARGYGEGHNPASRVASLNRKVGLVGFAFVVPLTAACLLAPEFLLGLFGEEFKAGAPTLRLLAAAHTFNVLTGPLGTSLIMGGQEKTVMNIELIASGLTVALGAALIPFFGMFGAAIAFSTAVVLRVVVSQVALRRLLARLG